MKRFAMLALAALTLLLGSPMTASAASLVANIDVSTQTMTVKRFGRVIHTWKVSTARRGYITPAGSWRPYRMHKMWHSRKYDMAPMPYAVFYHGGFAVHGTTAVSRLGTPASHGCVRLQTENAATFYALVSEVGPGNTRIIVSN
ncbi:MAG: L,D-transpeptidase [Mesorhizobium sp.]|nr:L,D-transpeptidase [Mesorhizobium sp.]